MYTGSCLCGGIQFRIDAELKPIQICHCTQCRKAQGGPIATNTPVSTSVFHLTGGRELLTEFEFSPGKKRCFCKICGSPIYGFKSSTSKSNWWPIHDDLPQYPDRCTVAQVRQRTTVLINRAQVIVCNIKDK